MKRACVILFFSFAFFSLSATAQVTTGTPPLGTFGGGPDVVNLANLNSHITAPVLSKAGRGLPFNFYLTDDSSVWYPVSSNGTKSWQPVTGWGWNQSEANIGSITVHAGSSSRLVICGDFYAGVITTSYSGWTYNDGFHTSHPFSFVTSMTNNTCTGQITTTSGQGTASDSSGYTLSVNGGNVTNLVGADGSVINPNTGSGSLEDRNGNLISLSSNGVITDTLGQTAMTIAGSGTPASPKTFTYQAPSTANAAYTEKFTAFTVQTKFQCTGINEFGPTTENLVTEIDLPDIGIAANDKYTITYETTPGDTHNPPYVTGRIASVTLPTGGTITYSYSGGSNGITCADGTAATLTRQTPDGTWSYVHSESGSAWTTTVTDPQGNQTAYNFQGIYQTERKVIQGGTTLEDDVTCYNSTTTNCNTTAIALPITKKTVKKTLGTQVCEHVYSYNSFGLLTEQDDYDYGNGAPGGVIRKELITYASLGNNIEDAPSQMTIENGSGTVVAQTTVAYDGSAVTSTTGTPQHVSITGSRGNPTSVSYLVAGTNSLTKTFTYFDTGNVQTATDVNGAQTTFTYGACGNSFTTLVTEPLSLTKSMTWNCIGGVQLSATDENSQTVSTAYSDAYFWRPATSTDQLSNVMNFYYQPNASFPSYEIARYMDFNSGTSEVGDFQYLDSLGRTYVDQHRETAGGSTLDSVSYTFDSNGRKASTSGPCAIGYAGTCSGPTTTQTYDALNRPLVTTDGGGGTVTKSYTGNDVTITMGPAPVGEIAKQRQLEYNSIGQLTSVCEITAGTPSAPAGTCGQTNPKTGYWTKYTYDVLGDLLTVTQNAQSSSTQSRTYTYDGLGRMTSESNPETGTKIYFYDTTPSGCWDPGVSYPGDLTAMKDAAGVFTCTNYDALHRPTDIWNSTNSATNPCKRFRYDNTVGVLGSRPTGVTVNNPNGHLVEAETDSCPNWPPTPITDEWFSYTARGEVSDLYESTPHSGGYYHSTATYWANGVLQNLTASTGYSTSYALDGEGRVYSAGPGGNQLASTVYNSASEPLIVTFASLDNDSFTYDPNTFRMTQYKYTVGSTPQSVVGNLTWNANGTLNKLAISDPFNAANTQTCNYTYDDLARLASGNCGSVWSQTFSYDAFGNLSKTGSEQFQPGYNVNNQMATGASYNANGDVLSDGLHSYTWDAYDRPTAIDSISMTYDALGRTVEENKAGVYTETLYSPTGFAMELMNGSSYVKAVVPMPGGTAEVWQASGGVQYYRHADWLGSSRFASTTGRTMYNDLAYAPFGEPYAQSGSTGVTQISFAGNNEDTATNLYDAQFREYGIQGRWPSPDPAGVAAANPANPQSWNRYAYVLNNPLSMSDPTGMAAGLRPEYYEYNIDVLFMSGDVIGAAEAAGGGGAIAGCDEFDLIDPNSFCNQIVMPIVTQTFNVQNWNNYYATDGYSADPCVYMNDSATAVESVDKNSSPGECSATGGTWVPPGIPFRVNPQLGVVQQNLAAHSICAAEALGFGGASLYTIEAPPVSATFAIAGLGFAVADYFAPHACNAATNWINNLP